MKRKHYKSVAGMSASGDCPETDDEVYGIIDNDKPYIGLDGKRIWYFLVADDRLGCYRVSTYSEGEFDYEAGRPRPRPTCQLYDSYFEAQEATDAKNGLWG